MKKLLLPLFALALLFSCEKDSTIELQPGQDVVANGSITTRGEKIAICHNGKIKSVSINAVPAHRAHGDAVDMDKDGFFDIDNPCGETDCDDENDELTDNCQISCVPAAFEVTVEVPGSDAYTLYVHPTDQVNGDPAPNYLDWGRFRVDIPDLTNYFSPPFSSPESAKAAALLDFSGAENTQKIIDELGSDRVYAARICAELEYNGCDDWYLPALGELNAIYEQLGTSREDFESFFYWSSTEALSHVAWAQYFTDGSQVAWTKKPISAIVSPGCRCVRR